jgi:hypothetical protein
MSRTWRLIGFDAFAREDYEIGVFATEAEAEAAADAEQAALEHAQPARTSGGPAGIQDQLFIVAPDGARRRVRPSAG